MEVLAWSSNAFTIGGHPERWSPRDTPDFSSPERVAVLSDEIAERVGIYMNELQEVPHVPGRKRWTVAYRGEGIVKPQRRL